MAAWWADQMSIESDVRQWSREVLEVPNKHLNGLPACPYAKQTWQDNKVLVVETDYVYAEAMMNCASFGELNKDVVVVASYEIPDSESFYSFVEALNDTFPELHCMEFHPDYGAEDAELDFLTDNDWESEVEQPYCMIFIQDLEKIVEASDRLEKLGYYDNYPSDEYDALVRYRRERLVGDDDDPD